MTNWSRMKRLLTFLFLFGQNIVQGVILQTDGGSFSTSPCLDDPPDCDGESLDNLPKGKLQSRWSLEASWGLSMSEGGAKLDGDPNGSLKANVSISRLSPCRIKVGISEANFDEKSSKTYSGDFTIVVNKRTIIESCSSVTKDVDERLAYLASSVASSILGKPLASGTALESDGFGICETTYTSKRINSTSKVIEKKRNLNNCGVVYSQLGGEKADPLWITTPMQKFEGEARYGCSQMFLNDMLTKIECEHVINLGGSSEFVSGMKLEFLSSEDSLVEEKQLNGLKKFPTTRIPDLLQYDETESVQSLMKRLCEELDNGLTSAATSTYPGILSKFQRMTLSEIMNLYSEVKQGTLCPNNHLLLQLLGSVLRASTSPAAASAKCLLIKKGSASLDRGWILSLGKTQNPTDDTLANCLPLMATQDLHEGLLGISSMAGKLGRTQCSSSKDCHFSESYNNFSLGLWSKAINCLNSREQYQKMALWALKGMARLHPATPDLIPALKTCATSPSASTEVSVESVKALGSDRCIHGTSTWLRELVLNISLISELRIEAFRSLHRCDLSEANSLLKLISTEAFDLQNAQVQSYLSSFSGKRGSWDSYLKLSQHLDVNLTEVFSFPRNSHLDGDIIFEDSFIPRSLQLRLKSEILALFGGSIKLGIRQDNLESVLQPLIGPGGFYNGIQHLVQEAIIQLYEGLEGLFQSKIKEEFGKNRQKRSVNLESIREAIGTVKTRVRETLNGWISVELGEEEIFVPFALSTLITKVDQVFQQWLQDMANDIYSSILDGKIEVAHSWNFQNTDVFAMTFFGPYLRLRQQQGLIAMLKGSSHVNLLSLVKSPFNPTIDLRFSPHLSVFRTSSLDFFTPSTIYKAETDEPFTSGFDASFRVRPLKLEHIEMKLNLPTSATHGYSSTKSKKLLKCIPSNVLQDIPNRVMGSSATHQDVKQCEDMTSSPHSQEDAASICNEDLAHAIGLRICLQENSRRKASTYTSTSRLIVKKDHEDIDYHKLTISTKNPSTESLFFSIFAETVGLTTEKNTTFIFGFVLSPHTTLKILLQGGSILSSFEASIVNDPNLKRLEARSTSKGEEYGLKAEILMVQDGGQVSVKPRLVLSRPWAKEDSLLEGYLAHYTSDKVKSFTMDVATDGSLKKVVDVTFKGTAEYRQKGEGDWSMSFKNLHMGTPDIKMGLEASLDSTDEQKSLQTQLTIDDEVIIFGGSMTDASHSATEESLYLISSHFLSPLRPNWNTKMNLALSLGQQQIRNNLTIENGEETNRREFNIAHVTSWKFIYLDAVDTPESYSSIWSALLRPKRASRIDSEVKISSNNFDWMISHAFESSQKSLENKVFLNHNGNQYTIMANFYDQSEELFRYHMEIESDFPEWEFSYVDTILQRSEGDILGQSTTKMPSGRVYSSSSRVNYRNEWDVLSFELSHDTLVKEGSELWRISARHTLESSQSNLNFLLSFDAPDPIINIEFSGERLDSAHRDYFLKGFLLNTFEGDISLGNTRSLIDLEANLLFKVLQRKLKGKVMTENFQGKGTFQADVSWLSTKDPLLAPITFETSSTVEFKDDRTTFLRSEMNLMGTKWTAELHAHLGRDVSDKKELSILLTFPKQKKYEAKARLLIDVQKRNERILDIFIFTRMPNDIEYKFSVAGEHKTRRGRLSEATLQLLIDSPFTQEVLFNSSVINKYNLGIRTFSIDANTHSEAEFWQPICIGINLLANPSNVDLNFEGKFAEQFFNLDFLGSYKKTGNLTNLKIVSEVKLPNVDSEVQQIKASVEGTIVKEKNSPFVKIEHSASLERNFINIFMSDAELSLVGGESSGKLVIHHNTTKFVKQEYNLEGTFTGSELLVSVKGTVNFTPVRIKFHYIDGQTFTGFASYGGQSYASIEFKTKLKRFSIGLKRKEKGPARLTTAGIVIYQGRKTRFIHTLKMHKDKTAANLRIQNILGKPFRVTATRVRQSYSHAKSDVRMTWGDHKAVFKDNINFKNTRDFYMEGSFAAPSFGVLKKKIHLSSSHRGLKDQTVGLSYADGGVTVHSGRLEVETSLLRSLGPWQVDLLLKNIIVGSKQYKDLKLSQMIHSSIASNLTMQTSLSSGQITLSEFSIESSNSSRQISFTLCSQEKKCIKVKAMAHAFSLLKPMPNFVIEFSSLNSLLVDNLEDGLQLQVFELFTENMIPEGGELTFSSKMARFRCKDLKCLSPHLLAVHHIALEVTKEKLDLQYKTINRTIAISAELSKKSLRTNENKNVSTERSENEAFIQFWFDRDLHPENSVFWNTSYSHFTDLEGNFIETIVSVIGHPEMIRPLKIEGELVSSVNNLKRDASILLEVFHDPANDLKITAVKDNIDGRHIFIAKLQSATEKRLHMSLTALGVPSAVGAQIDLRGVVTNDGSPSTSEDEIRLKCDSQEDKLSSDFTCQLRLPSFRESTSIGYEKSDTCSGRKFYANVFDESYDLYGQECYELPSIRYGLSLSNKEKDVFDLEVGILDSKSFHISLLKILEGIVTLHPPFLLEMNYNRGAQMLDTWNHFQDAITRELNFLSEKTKRTFQKIQEDSIHLLSRLKELEKPSSVDELGQLFKVNLDNIIREFQRDELAQDFLGIIKSSANIASYGISYLVDHLHISSLVQDLCSTFSPTKMRQGLIVISNEISKAFLEEINSIVHFGNDIMNFIVAYGKGIVNKAMTYPNVKHPIQWIKKRIMSFSQHSLYEFSLKAFNKVVQSSLWISSWFYPDIDAGDSDNAFLIPLPESSYTLLEIVDYITGSDERGEHKKTLSEKLEEISLLIEDTEDLLEAILPPEPAHAVVLSRNMLTFDGKVRSIDPTCTHLLLVTATRNYKQISLSAGPLNSSRVDERRDFAILFGDDVINIGQDFEASFNNMSVWLPFDHAGVHISRDVDRIWVSLSEQNTELFKLICHIHNNGCVVKLNGWLRSDVVGLLGNYDKNAFIKPPWEVLQCSKESPQVSFNSRTKYLCGKALLGYKSPLLPCHDLLDIKPYYDLCITSFDKTHSNITKPPKNSNHEGREASSHGSNRSHGKMNFTILPDASISEAKTICNTMASYTSICQSTKLDMTVPLDCQELITRGRLDDQIDDTVMVDILLFIEQTSCMDFLQDNLLRPLPKTMSNLVQKTNISAMVGAIGYASSSNSDLIFYGRGSNLLVPLEEFVAPNLPSEDSQKGSLKEALPKIKTFPFRDGSVRIALVVSCSSQDLDEVDPRLIKMVKEKRMLVYTLVPSRLLIDPDKPKAVRNIIGMDSKYLYHLKRERIVLSNNWKLNKPTSNIAQFALQSGGGVFSVSSIDGLKKTDVYMESFRDLLSKTMLFFSRQSHMSRISD